MPSAHAADRLSLVADIGGTNTRVALANGATLLPDTIRRYRNAEHSGLEPVIRLYVEAEGGVDCKAASVAIAGPVRNGRGKLTNLDWTIDEGTLAQATGAETAVVLNDLQAQGHALGLIPEANLRQVVDGVASEGAKLVIGVGTGFNVAPVHDLGDMREVPPSEAGHASLPIRTEDELRLSQYVEKAHGFPAVEDVLSGRGLERVYAWLSDEAGDPTDLAAHAIMESCEAGTDPRAARAVEVFVHMLGTEAGNQALVHLPFGGVYLVGGVSRAMAPHFTRYGFADAFRAKGRFGEFMKNFPVYIVEDDYAALTGMAAHLSRIT